MFCKRVDLSSFYKQLSQGGVEHREREGLFNQTHSSAVLSKYKRLQREYRWGLGESLQRSRKEYNFNLGISGIKALEIVQTKYFPRAHSLATTESAMPVNLNNL